MPTQNTADPRPAEKWDVEYKDGDKAIRANAKRYSVRDGLAKTSLELQLAKRYPAESTTDEQGVEMLYLINHYPLLKFGIGKSEGLELPLTEDAFWDLPESFVFDTCEAIREANPQYAVPFFELLRTLRNISPTSETAQPPSPTSASEPSAKPG